MTKISKFTQVQTFEQTDLVNIVRNATNYTVPFSAYSAALGVTGSIAPVGIGTPLLYQPTATTNFIRGIESGNGILASLSASNGVNIKHNFSFDSSGESLIVNSDVASPVFKSLVAKDNITLTPVGNTIEINAVLGLSTDTVYVNEEADFPNAVAGVITLLADTVYIITSEFSTANRFVMSNNTTVFGWSVLGPLLTYTGSGTMFTSVDVDCVFNNLHVKASSGKVFDCSATTPGVNIVGINNVNIMECVTVGTFTSLFSLAIDNMVGIPVTNGINFVGTGWNLINIVELALISASAGFIAVDLGVAVADNINILDMFTSAPSGAIGIKGAASSANLTATGRGQIAASSFIGAIAPLSGIVINDDVQWNSSNNQGIKDTRPDSLSYNTAGTTVTISVQSTPVKIGGTWVDDNSSHFTVDGSGRSTYNGINDLQVPITLTVTADPASGGATDFIVYIAINGTVQTGSGVPARAAAADREPVTVIWQHEFETGDYVEAFLSNETGTVDFDVIHAVLRVD